MNKLFSLADTQPEFCFQHIPVRNLSVCFPPFYFLLPQPGRHPKQKSEDQRLSDPDIPVEKGFIWFRVLGCAMVAMRDMSSIATQRWAAFFWAGVVMVRSKWPSWMIILPTKWWANEQRVAIRWGLSTKFLSFKNNPESLKVVQIYSTGAGSSSEIEFWGPGSYISPQSRMHHSPSCESRFTSIFWEGGIFESPNLNAHETWTLRCTKQMSHEFFGWSAAKAWKLTKDFVGL